MPEQSDLFTQPSQRAARRTRAPDTLQPHEWTKLREWAESRMPWITRGALGCTETLEGYVEETLDYWISEGKTKANWLATIRNRIRTVERRRVDSLAKAGSESARLALKDPDSWRERYDARAAVVPEPTINGGERLTPGGGRVFSLHRKRHG